MMWHKEYLDFILVPSGISIMLIYHLFLLYRCIRCPQSTVIGFETHCKRTWVQKIMQVDIASRSPAQSVITNNITAANFMASTSLTLSSLIGTWIGSFSKSNYFVHGFVYGDTGQSLTTLKYVSILVFFLASFACFIQTTRHFVHANFLLTMPLASVPIEFVEVAVIRGSYFWHAGLRAVYFASISLLWVFGPIPMFVSSVATVMILYILDANTNPFHDFQQPGKQGDRWGNNSSDQLE